MGAPTPQFIPEAFAISAAPGDRNTIPAAPLTTQRASFDLGFPPLTMLPIVAGGKPMLGPDMNGILYMISSHTVYVQSGQPYKYNVDVATSIGGYAVGTILGSADGSTVWYNLLINNSDDPDVNGALGWVALFSYGMADINTLIGGSRTLTNAEAAKSILVLTGLLAANQQLVLPNTIRSWLVVNACTGGFTVTVKTTAGSGVVVPAGGFASPTEVYGNGTDINPTFVPAALPIDVNATPNTIPVRDNTGRVLSVTPVAGDNTTYVATSQYVQGSIIGGIGQAWTDVTGSRTFNTTYTNLTGRPIQLGICTDVSPGGGVAIRIDGVIVGVNINGTAGDTEELNVYPVVPAGSTYRLDLTGGGALTNWAELR